ncbi:hypothetical protein RintRC_0111 [Richelia intracellularis]|nr:hypothetical protein RintRC_0111 [Richelia intracellularis]
MTYIEETAVLLDLKVRDEYIDEVVNNFELIRVIAEVVNEFPLPPEVECAPIFEA